MTLDLLELVRQDTGAEFRHAAATRGGEHQGRCPLCGGEDRFSCWPADTAHNGKAYFTCHNGDRAGCGVHGDLADYLEIVRKMPHLDALKAAGVIDGNGQIPTSTARPAAIASTTRAHEVNPPCDQWQARALAFVGYAQGQLWSEPGALALAYLMVERKLTEETIKHYGLGYNPQGISCPGPKWGQLKRVFCPHGVTIPTFAGGALWSVLVRRPAYRKGTKTPDALGELLGHVVNFAEDTKYLSVTGSERHALFGADDLRGDGRPLLVCEGEFDAMLAWQELRGLADVCALKTGKAGLPSNWIPWLLPYSLILVAYDVDGNGAGDKMAAAWPELTRRARRVRVPEGSDLTDFYNLGGDLPAWVGYQVGQNVGL